MSTGTHRWLVLAAMAGSASMIMLDQTVVAVALPSMSRELNLSAVGQQWVINAYGLSVAALVAFFGKLADRFGGVIVFRSGVVVFFIGSLACSAAPADLAGEIWIIASRALQGIGAALMIPVSAALVVNAFAAATRGRAIAVYSGISQVFLAIGPIVGGLLTENLSWRAVFLLNVPLGIAVLVLVKIARPVSPGSPASAVHPGPAALLVSGLALTVIGLQQAARWGPTAPATLTMLTAGAALTLIFARSQWRSPNPLLDLRLLAHREFVGNVVVLGMFQFALLATVVFGSLYLQDVLGLSPSQTGITVLAFVLPIMAAAQLGGWWYDRRGVRAPVLSGLALTAIGVLGWAAAVDKLGDATGIPGMIVTGFGLGLSISPCYTDALSRVGPQRRGQASGVIQTFRQIGGILGVLVIGSVVVAAAGGSIRTAPHDIAAHAVALGFVAAAIVFLVALIFGFALLPRSRVSDHALPPEPMEPTFDAPAR